MIFNGRPMNLEIDSLEPERFTSRINYGQDCALIDRKRKWQHETHVKIFQQHVISISQWSTIIANDVSVSTG